MPKCLNCKNLTVKEKTKSAIIVVGKWLTMKLIEDLRE
jgi:hypothetical protein